MQITPKEGDSKEGEMGQNFQKPSAFMLALPKKLLEI